MLRSINIRNHKNSCSLDIATTLWVIFFRCLTQSSSQIASSPLLLPLAHSFDIPTSLYSSDFTSSVAPAQANGLYMSSHKVTDLHRRTPVRPIQGQRNLPAMPTIQFYVVISCLTANRCSTLIYYQNAVRHSFVVCRYYSLSRCHISFLHQKQKKTYQQTVFSSSIGLLN